VKAFDTVTDDAQPAVVAGSKPGASELTTWLLEGRFFTVGPTGNVTSWSPRAAEVFGWGRKEILGEAIGERLAPGVALGGYSGSIEARDEADRTLPAEFAFVPIELSVGYEFNSLLQDISGRSTDAHALAEFAKTSREPTFGLLDRAWSGGAQQQPAGWLVVFRAGAASAAAASAAPPMADNVVSIADAAGTEEARAQLERLRHDAEEGRVEIRSLSGQLEEARREAQRARQEVDVARQEAGDSRDALTVAQREVEDARRQLEEARRQTDEVRAAAEGARIRSEEAQRETQSLREQLREARESVRGMAGRADDELAQAQERQAAAERALSDARADVARHEAEVEPLRERYQAAQREVGTLRADLESARAAAAEREAVGERRAAELEAARAELAAARAELTQSHSELAEARSLLAADAPTMVSPPPDHETAALRERLDRMRVAFQRAPVAGALIAPDGRYMEVSDSFCEILGHSHDRLMAQDPPPVVHPDDAEARRDLVQGMLAGDRASASGYKRYVHADGHAITMREKLALVRDGEGRPEMFVLQVEEADQQGSAGVVIDAEVEPVAAAPEQLAALTGDAMRRALEDDLFELHCQPVLDLRTNEITQHELLIRMRGEDGRLILPQAFLGPARRAGLAHAIDRWVVRRAIRLLEQTGPEISLEVNLSPEAVHDAELPGMVDEELAGSAVDPARLVLEVSGGTAADHIEETRELAKRLRGLGCRFALDDFRSNFGSFRLLRDLPLDYLKLDGELVASLAESRTSQLIVKALVDVAAGTGMKTIAVFVSDDETVQMLRGLGVGYAQGYAIGRPRPAGEVLQGTVAPQLPPG
jgi:PAS domain S-box-containing protein